jgi:uncharacterized protein
LKVRKHWQAKIWTELQELLPAVITILLFLIACSPAAQSSPAVAARKPQAKSSLSAAKASGTDPAPKPVKGSKLFMWKMTSGSGATVYFIGTIHLARTNFYPLADEFEKAFQKSRALLVEADISDKRHARSPALLSREFYPEGDDLSKHISPSTLRALEKYCAATDVSESKFMTMRPWFVSIVVQQMEMQRLGFLYKNGIDLHFIEQANKIGKRVITLEKDHDDVLAGMSAELQDKVLRLSLIDVDMSTPDELDRLMKIWKAGDEAAMNALMSKGAKKESDLSPYQDRLLYDRNLKMADTIEPYLKGDGVYMVAVGSAHLVGERNIIELLAKRGYQYKQVLAGDEI